MDRVSDSTFEAFDLVVESDEVFARPTVPPGCKTIELQGHVAEDLAAATRAAEQLRRCLRLCDGYRSLVHADIEVPEILDTVWRSALSSYAEPFRGVAEDTAAGRIAQDMISALTPYEHIHDSLLVQNNAYLQAHFGLDTVKTFVVLADTPLVPRGVIAVGAVELPYGRSHAVDVSSLELVTAVALSVAQMRATASEARVRAEVVSDPIDDLYAMPDLRFLLH